MAHFKLPAPQKVNNYAALRELLDFAPLALTASSIGCVWTSILGATDFVYHLAGSTGLGKSSFAAVIQSFFGAGFAKDKGKNLPGSWANLTAIGAQSLVGQVSHALVVLDDYKQSADSRETPRQQKIFDNVARPSVNGQQRLRSKQTGGLDESTYKPSALIYSTGEDTPAGESLNARLFRYELTTSLISDRLTHLQHAAIRGDYAALTSSFIQWLVPNWQTLQTTREVALDAIRDRLRINATEMHGRSISAVASLLYGWQTFLDFAVEAQGYTRDEADALLASIETALLANAQEQQEAIRAESCTDKFINTINTLLLTEKVRIIPKDGKVNAQAPSTSNGELIGYYDTEGVYLIPEMAMKVVQEFLRATGDGIGEKLPTLTKRLNDTGLIASIDKGRNTKTVYPKGQAKGIRSIHIKPDVLNVAGGGASEPKRAPEPVDWPESVEVGD